MFSYHNFGLSRFCFGGFIHWRAIGPVKDLLFLHRLSLCFFSFVLDAFLLENVMSSEGGGLGILLLVFWFCFDLELQGIGQWLYVVLTGLELSPGNGVFGALLSRCNYSTHLWNSSTSVCATEKCPVESLDRHNDSYLNSSSSSFIPLLLRYASRSNLYSPWVMCSFIPLVSWEVLLLPG